MRGINKVILVGNLGADPEVKQTQTGGYIATLSVATSEQWNDRQSGQKHEKTEWHRVVLFNRLAEIAQQYLRKGGSVYIEGKIQTRKWQNQQGVDVYTTEVVAQQMQMLGGGGSQPPSSGSPQRATNSSNKTDQLTSPENMLPDDINDIPFDDVPF